MVFPLLCDWLLLLSNEEAGCSSSIALTVWSPKQTFDPVTPLPHSKAQICLLLEITAVKGNSDILDDLSSALLSRQ